MSHPNPLSEIVRYAVVLIHDPDTDSYSVFVPALPGCFSVGDTVDDSLANAREAITVHLELPDGAQHVAEDRVEAIMATVAVGGA